MKTPEETHNILNRVCKWRRFFVGWQLGSRLKNDPEANALSDHRELSIMLRVEVNALAALLISKGVFTHAEYADACGSEAETLDATYQQRFPGFKSSDAGMVLEVQIASDTMRVMNFPP